MKRIIIYIIFITATYALKSQTWEFIPNSSFIPDKNTVFNSSEEWIPKALTIYNGYTVFGRSLHGVALVKDGKWTFWTPEYIKSRIINEEALDIIDFKCVNIYQINVDNNNNLWLMADRYLLKYNNDGFYCYYEFSDSNANNIQIESLNGMDINNDQVYVRVQNFYNTEKLQINVINCIVTEANQLKEISRFNADTSLLKFENFMMVIRKFHYDSKVNYLQYEPSIEYLTIYDSTFTPYSKKLFKYASRQADIFRNGSDTFYIIDRQFNIYKLVDTNFIEVDSSIKKIEEKYVLYPQYGIQIIMSLYTKSGFDGYTYFLPGPSKSIDRIIPSRIYKYKDSSNIEEIIIPKIPDLPEYIESSNYTVDSLGRIWIVYGNYGLYIYYPEGLGIDTDIEEEYYPRVWIWNLYPNPASESAKLEFHLTKDVKDECKIQIVDVRGNIIKEIKDKIEYDNINQEATVQFSTSEIATGVYYVLISTSKSKKLRQLQVIR